MLSNILFQCSINKNVESLCILRSRKNTQNSGHPKCHFMYNFKNISLEIAKSVFSSVVLNLNTKSEMWHVSIIHSVIKHDFTKQTGFVFLSIFFFQAQSCNHAHKKPVIWCNTLVVTVHVVVIVTINRDQQQMHFIFFFPCNIFGYFC